MTRSSISTHDQRDRGWKCCEGLVGGKRRRMWKPPSTFSVSPHQLHRFLWCCHWDWESRKCRLPAANFTPTTKTLQHILLASTRTQHLLTLLSLRLSSVNNLGVKVLQEVLESFKLYNHGNDCLISEWRSWGCSQEQELNVLKSDLEGFHPCISVFGVCCLHKIGHQLLLYWGWRGRLA